MSGKLAILAVCLLLFGCTSQQGYLESLYGDKVTPAIRACLTEAGNSDPQFYECVVKVAKGSGSGIFCDQAFPASGGTAMDSKRDSCMFHAESGKHDSSFCGTLVQAGFAPYCRAMVDLSADECAFLDDNQTFCLMSTELVNIEGAGSSLVFKCVSPKRVDCLTDVAGQTKSSSPCEKIGSMCNITTDITCRLGYDACYTSLAEISDNSTLCQSLGKPFSGSESYFYNPDKSVSECVLKTFGSPDKLSECSKLSGVQAGQCITEYAVSTKDPSQCAKIGGELNGSAKLPIHREDYTKPGSNWSVYALGKTHDDCLTSIASSLRDPSICDSAFYVDTGRALCIIEAATAKNDPSVCERIADDLIRASCKAQFGKAG